MPEPSPNRPATTRTYFNPDSATVEFCDCGVLVSPGTKCGRCAPAVERSSELRQQVECAVYDAASDYAATAPEESWSDAEEARRIADAVLALPLLQRAAAPESAALLDAIDAMAGVILGRAAAVDVFAVRARFDNAAQDAIDAAVSRLRAGVSQ